MKPERAHAILFLAISLTLAACGETAVNPSTDGTLVVTTASTGNDPDPDGYLLTVDGVDSIPLEPRGSSEIDLSAGSHSLLLLGMAEHCSVLPGNPLDVVVPSGGTASVAFEVICSKTGARITTTTTGLDLDLDGYRLQVDGGDRGFLPSSGTVLTQIDPGSHTIALTGMTPNCTIEGPAARTVTIVDREVASVEVSVVCTATSGAIGVIVAASGADVRGSYEAWVDEARSFFVRPGQVAYLTGVPVGDHVVSLVVPNHCSLETDPQPVSVTAGALIRDTVEVTFSVTCVQPGPANVQISAPTTGPTPRQAYSVWICQVFYDCIFYGTWRPIAVLAPNGTALIHLEPGRYALQLKDVPQNCTVRPSSLSPTITVGNGDNISIEFRVECS